MFLILLVLGLVNADQCAVCVSTPGKRYLWDPTDASTADCSTGNILKRKGKIIQHVAATNINECADRLWPFLKRHVIKPPSRYGNVDSGSHLWGQKHINNAEGSCGRRGNNEFTVEFVNLKNTNSNRYVLKVSCDYVTRKFTKNIFFKTVLLTQPITVKNIEYKPSKTWTATEYKTAFKAVYLGIMQTPSPKDDGTFLYDGATWKWASYKSFYPLP